MLEENRFENVLKSFRVRRGKEWDQPKTAELLGIGLRTYKAWENGEYVPPHHQLQNIVATFRLTEKDEATLYRAAAQVPPEINNLPFPPNPLFTGREAYLEQLHMLFSGDKGIKPVSICAMGGIGKTQLALEYAHRCYQKGIYRAVFWVDASEEAMIGASYIVVAELLGLPELQLHNTERIVRAVKQWLQEHTHWLLIMDNADDLQLARSFLPVTHQGHILLTTRSQIIGGIARQIDLAEMEPAEGVRFILLRSRTIQEESELNTVAPDVRTAAQKLVSLLGGHPLALDQAAAYVEETGVSFEEYTKLFREYRNFLLHRQGEERNIPRSVAAIISISVTKASERHPLATDILCFCALLQPDAIPEELFQYDERFKTDPLACNEAIAALQRYSLLKHNRQQNAFSMHRLVQAVMNDTMSPDIKMQWGLRIEQAIGVFLSGAMGVDKFRWLFPLLQIQQDLMKDAVAYLEKSRGTTYYLKQPDLSLDRKRLAELLRRAGHEAEAAAVEGDDEPPA